MGGAWIISTSLIMVFSNVNAFNAVNTGFGKRDCNSRTKVRVEIVAFVGLKLCGIVCGEIKTGGGMKRGNSLGT